MKIAGLILAATTTAGTFATDAHAQPASTQQLECRWGHGASVPQPASAAGVNLTCTPPSVIGSGATTVDFDASRILDVLSRANKHAERVNRVVKYWSDNHKDMFPMKMQVPLMFTVYAKVHFKDFRALDEKAKAAKKTGI